MPTFSINVKCMREAAGTENKLKIFLPGAASPHPGLAFALSSPPSSPRVKCLLHFQPYLAKPSPHHTTPQHNTCFFATFSSYFFATSLCSYFCSYFCYFFATCFFTFLLRFLATFFATLSCYVSCNFFVTFSCYSFCYFFSHSYHSFYLSPCVFQSTPHHHHTTTNFKLQTPLHQICKTYLLLSLSIRHRSTKRFCSCF